MVIRLLIPENRLSLRAVYKLLDLILSVSFKRNVRQRQRRCHHALGSEGVSHTEPRQNRWPSLAHDRLSSYVSPGQLLELNDQIKFTNPFQKDVWLGLPINQA